MLGGREFVFVGGEEEAGFVDAPVVRLLSVTRGSGQKVNMGVTYQICFLASSTDFFDSTEIASAI